MKVRCRLMIFAISLLACVIVTPKAFASYNGAAYKLYVTQYYQALANFSALYAFYYDSNDVAYYAYVYLAEATPWATNAYNEARAAYLGDGNISGYYAQYFAFYAKTYAWYAETYMYYTWQGYDYGSLAIDNGFLASYFAALSAFYAGRAS